MAIYCCFLFVYCLSQSCSNRKSGGGRQRFGDDLLIYHHHHLDDLFKLTVFISRRIVDKNFWKFGCCIEKCASSF